MSPVRRVPTRLYLSFLEPRLSFTDFCGKNATVETGKPSISFSVEVDYFVRFEGEDTEVRLGYKTVVCFVNGSDAVYIRTKGLERV